MRIHEAAAEVHLHPCELVMELARLGADPFDGEVFPDTNSGYIDTLKQMRKRLKAADKEPSPPPPSLPPLSEEALQILRALRYKKHWGTNVAAKEQIIRHYCKGLSDYDRPLRELVQSGLVRCRGELRHGPYFLNLEAKARIEQLVGPDAGGS